MRLFIQMGAGKVGRISLMAVHQIRVTCNCAHVLWAHNVYCSMAQLKRCFADNSWQQFEEPSNDRSCSQPTSSSAMCLYVCCDLILSKRNNIVHSTSMQRRLSLVPRLPEKFPAVYGARDFVTVFKRVCRLSLS